MIDITVDNNEVKVEGQIYHSFNNREALKLMLNDIIERCLYSGESISLWIIRNDRKENVQEWINPHVSSRYNRRNEI